MEAGELRIGNLVRYRFNIIKVNSIDFSGINLVSDYNLWACQNQIKARVAFRDIIPVPLNEEWLLKCGFKKECDYFIFPDFPVLGELCTETNMKYVFDTEKDELRLYFVHQLQNLYFALTGSELAIAP